MAFVAAYPSAAVPLRVSQYPPGSLGLALARVVRMYENTMQNF